MHRRLDHAIATARNPTHRRKIPDGDARLPAVAQHIGRLKVSRRRKSFRIIGRTRAINGNAHAGLAVSDNGLCILAIDNDRERERAYAAELEAVSRVPGRRRFGPQSSGAAACGVTAASSR